MSHRASLRPQGPLALLACLLPLLLTGCIRVYQPLRGMQRPTAIDPRLSNFEGVKLLVRCLPEEAQENGLGRSGARMVCSKMATLFRNQGAKVETLVPRPGTEARSEEGGESRPDLVVDLRVRMVHAERNLLLTLVSFATLTLVPALSEENWAHEVTVREPGGFVLASESLQARFVDSMGVGVWGVNWAMDVLVRPPEEEVTGNVATRDYSWELYAQLSQLVFNARMRSLVLRSFEPAP